MASADTRTPGRFALIQADASEQIAREIRMYVEREGLRRLAGSHLIRVQKGRAGGVFVDNTPNVGIGRHVSESIAAMLECESVTLCELVEAGMFLAEASGEEFRMADARLHRAIAQTAGNDLLRSRGGG